MSYQNKTGPLMANSHPGSYCGQDAYSDMLVTERERESMDIRNAEVRQLGVEQNSVNDERETVQVGDRPDSNGCSEEYVARRLTPTECARLQGFPPDWCSDVPHSDSAEYKLWGNGIALPCLFNLFKAIVDVYEAEDEEHEESRLQADTLLTEEAQNGGSN